MRSIPLHLTHATLLALAAFAVGCTHTMEIKNAGEYQLAPTRGARQNVAVRRCADPEAQALFAHTVEALRAHPSVGQLRTDWSGEAPDGDFEPDVVVSIHPRAEMRGSGWNYLVTFPGFLLFTHAWNGYVYSCEITTDVKIESSRGEVLEQGSIVTDYSLRHCDFGRGFWASSGWWMPGYGASSAIAGLFMLPFDPRRDE